MRRTHANDGEENMSWCRCEPTLEDILSDPIVAAVMQADAVDVHELDELLSDIADRLTHSDDVGWAKRSVPTKVHPR
jgi:hypothetical protein